MRKFIPIAVLLFGIIAPVAVNASATTCLNLASENLVPMNFTITKWSSNGISKEYVDSSYRAFGSFGVEPWLKNSNYLPPTLLDKLNEIPANEKNVEVWFEKSSTQSFLSSKKIGWAAFPAEYKPYLEIDTVIYADAGDWLRFSASIQIKDCGSPIILKSSPAQYPFGSLTPISIETINGLKQGVKSNLDDRQIDFGGSGASPWHFLTLNSMNVVFKNLDAEIAKPRDIGERFLIPNNLGFQNELRLMVRPVSPTDCLGFEFRNLKYTNEGTEIFFSKLPCQIIVTTALPPKLYLGPLLPRNPTSPFTLDCFDCYTNVTIANVTVTAKPTIKKTTIVCVKGKLTKKVTALKPVCPKGYTKK